jgi:uncharacterized membrane-anchored protein
MTTLRDALAGTSAKSHAVRLWLSAPRSAWYVDAVVGAGLWVGAALLVLVLALFGVADEPVVCAALGLCGLVGAAVIPRVLPHATPLAHLSFVLVVLGSSLMLASVMMSMKGDVSFGVTLAVLGIVVFAAVPGRTTRFAAVMAMGLGTGIVADDGGHGAVQVDVALWCVATTILWLWRPSLIGGPATQLVRVGAVAAPVVAVVTWIVDARDLGMYVRMGRAPQEDIDVAALVLVAVIAACGVVVAKVAHKEHQAPRSVFVVGAVAAVVVAVVGRHAPLALIGVLLCALAAVRRDTLLQGLGVVVLLVGVGWMLWMDGSLSRGALTCFGLGVVVLATRAAVLFFVDGGEKRDHPPADGSIRSPLGARPPWLTREGIALSLSVVLSVAVVGGLMIQREALHARGRTVLLELAPVDPRSILQGDYMILRYAASLRVPARGADAGVAVFAVDDNGVAQFVGEVDEHINDGNPVGDGDVRLRFRRRDGRVMFGSETFLFEEGRGAHFAKARYAEVRVDDDGAFLVVDLRDADRTSLGGTRR